MTQRSKAFGMVALAAAGLALAGCGNSSPGIPSTTASTATSRPSMAATTTNSVAPQWDPCTIPDSAITNLGLNAATKNTQVAGVTFDGWKVCGWKSADKTYNLTIFTSSHTLEEFKQRTDFSDFTTTTVGNHTAVQYRSVGADHDLGCSITTQVSGGTVDFDVLNRYGNPGLGDPCVIVRRLADGLGQYLPA